MSESHNIEYKQSWKDEYLKWICGFANAQGGSIYIGINDKGQVVKLENTKKLLEDLPNKIVNFLGIVADVNLLNKNNGSVIEINVTPSSVPISYKGVYYYRSGSTMQELRELHCNNLFCVKLVKHGTIFLVLMPHLTTFLRSR